MSGPASSESDAVVARSRSRRLFAPAWICVTVASRYAGSAQPPAVADGISAAERSTSRDQSATDPPHASHGAPANAGVLRRDRAAKSARRAFTAQILHPPLCVAAHKRGYVALVLMWCRGVN